MPPKVKRKDVAPRSAKKKTIRKSDKNTNKKAVKKSVVKKKEEHDPALSEELKSLLDNFGQSVSEPILTGRTAQETEGSVVEVSVRKVVYKEKQPIQSNIPEVQSSKELTTTTTAFHTDLTTNDVTDLTRSLASDTHSIPECFCTCGNVRHVSDSMCNCRSDNSPINEDQCTCGTLYGGNVCEYPDCTCHGQPSRNILLPDDNNNNEEGIYRDEVKGLGREIVDRYSLNHIQYSTYRPPPPPKKSERNWSILSFFKKTNGKETDKKSKKRRRTKNGSEREISSGSGLTIPQLYKANVSRTIGGVTPGKFTFRAVTGCPQLFESSNECYCNHSMGSFNKKIDFNEPVDIKVSQDDFGVQVIRSKEKASKTCNTDFKNVSLDDYQKAETHPEKISNVLSKTCHHGICNKECFGCQDYIVNQTPPERIDIYCFDHLNTGYFRTSDHPPPLISEIAMEKVEIHATRFWAEVFGFIHIAIAFLTAFILQLYKFILYGLVRPLMIGLVQLSSDYFFKPLLTVTYNGIIQPMFIFLYNISTSFRDLCRPIARGIGYFITEIASFFKAIRLVDWKHTTVTSGKCNNAKCTNTKNV